ncbi:hypothetical protein [Paraburkholderia dilworthii]|nr:hypothetical protein [Paraburkholderia dilworthii]
MKKLIVKIVVGAVFLFAAECLLSPKLSTNEVIGLYLIVAAAAL